MFTEILVEEVLIAAKAVVRCLVLEEDFGMGWKKQYS